ncbi:MAG: hypothetical protein ACPL7D_06325 [Candidatus Sumerlaeaceae bacterium]
MNERGQKTLLRIRRVLLALLFFATLFRIVPVAYDAPSGGLFSSDEIDAVSRALKFATGDLLPIHANKPTHYAEILATAYGAQYAVEHLFLGTTREDFERRFFLAPFLFYATARFMTAGFAVGLLSFLLWSLRRQGLGAQLVAIALVAFASSSVKYSHIAKEDVVAQFWSFVAFAAALELLVAARKAQWHRVARWLRGSAFAAGLAVSTKYNCFWVALFPLLAWELSYRDAAAGDRKVLRHMSFSGLLALAAGFVIGTPAVILEPVRFFRATLSSDIVSEVGHGLASLYYADKYGWRFFTQIWDAELGLAWVSVLLGAGLFLERARRLRALIALPVALYLATLLLAGHLDYQYAILVTPITAWMLGHEMTVRAHEQQKRLVRLAILFFLAVGLVQNFVRVARRTAEYLGGDTRIAAARWIEQQAASGSRFTDKPLLIVSPFYYRYYPTLAFTPRTFANLLQEARRHGREGGYFERAMKYAAFETRPQFDADFLDVKWHFHRLSDGTRQFLPQPFSLSLRDYAGKYSAVIVPEQTLLYLELDPPEASETVKFLREIKTLSLLAEFAPKPWRRAGPKIYIFKPPEDSLTSAPRVGSERVLPANK